MQCRGWPLGGRSPWLEAIRPGAYITRATGCYESPE